MRNGGKAKKNDLIVVRVNGEGKFCNSRPCYNCLAMMKAVNIRKVFYTDDSGEVIGENVKDMVSIQASAITKQIFNMKTDNKFNLEQYFEILLKKFFPPTIKRINLENFIKHNLVNVLPGHKYVMNHTKGFTMVSIMNKEDMKIVSAKILD